MDIPTITTQRLVLRAPRVTDAEDVFVFRGDPVVQQFNDDVLGSVADTRAFLEYLLAECAADRRRHWALSLDGVVVGLMGLHDWQHHHRRAEFGYDLAAAHWGRGLAAEAARAVLDVGFREMGLHRVQAFTIADNTRSVRLLERLGFQREGTMREFSLEADGVFHDSAVYGLLRRQH